MDCSNLGEVEFMKKLHFEVNIRASQEAVWDAVVDDEKYREWAAPFHEGSYFEGGWNKGDKIRFLARNEKGEPEGMIAEIAESRKPEFISIRHFGMILGGKEDTTSDEVKKWVPAYENYTFTRLGNFTKFEVDADTEESFVELFSGMWPKALAKLKEVAERAELKSQAVAQSATP
jgi:uncharacterized protein YndB with AHSA1/START domain